MCSIQGALAPLGGSLPDRRRWLSALELGAGRGPDGTFFDEIDGQALLGHSSLKTTGDSFQPFRLAAGSRRLFWAVNGQFYGHAAIARRLLSAGAHIQTGCDSEILGWLYLIDGIDGLRELRGEFAFALFDASLGRPPELLLARDPDGARPLHHGLTPEGAFAFASSWNSAARLCDASGLDLAYLRESFEMQYPPPDRAFVRGLARLEPGELLQAAPTQDGFAVERSPLPRIFRPGARHEPSAAGVFEALQAAVDERIPEGRVSAHLSAGIDSAAVCSLAAARRGDLACYCVDFGPGGEADGAVRNAKLLGLKLELVPYGIEAALDELPAAVRLSGFSCMDAHMPAKAAMSALMRRHGHRVALSGEGSDEAFLGYVHCQQELGTAPITEAPMPGVHLPSAARAHPACEAALGFTPRWIQAKLEAAERLKALLSPDFLALPVRGELLVGAPPNPLNWDRPRLAAETWRARAMSQYILPAIDDGTGAAQGLETRMPFLDEALLDLARSIPSERHLRGGRSKALLREALAPVLPPEIREAPKRPFMGPSLSAACAGSAALASKLAELTWPAIEAGWLAPDAFGRFFEEAKAAPGAQSDAILWALASSAQLTLAATEAR